MLLLLVGAAFNPRPTYTLDLPDNFENVQIVSDLNEPDSFRFSPDGRIFISERITGRLLVAKYESATESWAINPEPFYTFDIPKDENGQPQSRRSGGLRDIVFDPDFESNGYIYAFYMRDAVLQNRVVRIKASTLNPDIADVGFGEELLIELPYNDTQASGSHNGGALEFADDGTLFITTGDGWEGEFEGDPVQSLTTFTGKVLRINKDGTIPADNPFYTQTSDAYRAIYALGLRNPYSMSKNPSSGTLYINEARGNNKASVYIVTAGANYGHESNAGETLGTPTEKWADASGGGGELITGGAWYPTSGPFPDQYHGGYFVALWGSNSAARGQISVIQSEQSTEVTQFEGDVGLSTDPPVKPVITRIGPDGNLYYMLTTYQTNSGTIQMVRYTGQSTAVTPIFTPNGGTYAEPTSVTITSTTPDATIRYTLDNTEPTVSSPRYEGPILISTSTLVKARAFKSDLNPSSTGSALFTIGDTTINEPPVVDAGSDKRAIVGQSIALDGSGTIDPDGDDDLLRDESWTQISGPPASILDATEEIAYFQPEEPGLYVFELSISDGKDTDTDSVAIAVYAADSCAANGLQALYTFDEGSGKTIHDRSGVTPPLDLAIFGGGISWISGGGVAINSQSSITSSGAAAKLVDASQSSGAFTVEVWLKPANVTQNGPARIFTLSANPFERNLTIGQGKTGSQPTDIFDFRLRTDSAAVNGNGEPSITTESGVATTGITHLTYSRQADGLTVVTVNGSTTTIGRVGGSLDNWDRSYALGLANEYGGNRGWLGELHHVAYYDCALDLPDVSTNFELGHRSSAYDNLPETPVAQTPPTTPIPAPNSSAPSVATPNSGFLSGILYDDQNRNQTQDDGELPLGGLIVVLTNTTSNDNKTVTGFTDATGRYHFFGVEPGEYQLTISSPSAAGPIGSGVVHQVLMPSSGNMEVPAIGIHSNSIYLIYLPQISTESTQK